VPWADFRAIMAKSTYKYLTTSSEDFMKPALWFAMFVIAFSNFAQVANGQSNKQTISLTEGWNLISTSVQPVNNLIQNVLSGIESKYLAVYAYNGTNYEQFIPGEESNTLNRIEPGRGYWIYLEESATLTVEGSPATSGINLKEGWNLVGFNHSTPLATSSALTSIRGRYDVVYSFNPSKGYLSYSVPDGGELTMMRPGEGYWIYANSAATWTIGSSTVPPGTRQVGQWDRFETTVSNSKNYNDPYTGVSLDVTYTKPDGNTIKFWGFYDGGNSWKIRYMPDQQGVWKYEAKFSDGTQGVSGSFVCVPSTIPGLIHKDETNPRWFGFKGGNHILLRSLHMGPVFRTTFPENKRKLLFDWAQQQGYNMFSTASFFNIKSRESGGPKLWPLNAEEYRAAEKILDDLSNRRMIVWGFSGWFGDGRPYPKDANGQAQYIKYGMARFGPYWNLLWNVGGPEPNLNNYLSSADVNRLGNELKKYDPFDHLRSVHNRHGNYPYKNAEWSTYATLQGSDSEHKDLKVQSAYLLRQHTGDKPVYGQEDLWPGNTKQPACCFDANTVRRWLWVHLMSAVTLNYGDMQGTSGTGFSGSGEMADKKQERHDWIKPVWDYFETIPFYRMSPNQEIVNNGFCLAEEGARYMVFVTTGSVNVRIKGGPYKVEWINAHNPSEKRNAGTTADGQNLTPPGTDWVLHLSK
jgi:hypothetical protein